MYRYFPNGASQFDANLHINWKDLVWVGGTYRQEAGYVVSAGFKIADQLSIAYAYEFNTTGIAARGDGSHEAMLGFSIAGKRKKDEEQDQKLEELANNQKDLMDQLDSLYKIAADKSQEEANAKKIDSLKSELSQLNTNMSDMTEQMIDFGQELADQSKRIDSKVDTGSITDLLTRLQVTKNEQTGETKVQEVELERGYYVVIQSFRSQENALHYVQGFNDRADRAIIVHNKSRGWYYCYLKKFDNLKDALEAMREIRKQGFEDAWVHIYKP